MSGFPDRAAAASAAGCCIPTQLLRRVLGFGNLPTGVLGYFQKDDDKKLVSPSGGGSCRSEATPGIVARLMGLESLPLVERSPSANSGDLIGRRSKPLRGMRVPMTYQEDEDDEFYIFNFQYPRRSGEKNERMKKNKSNKVRENEQNLGSKVNTMSEVGRKNENKIDSGEEGSSENSSPNSVLEFVEFPAGDRQASCSGDQSRLGNSRMRRMLSDELETCERTRKKLPSSIDDSRSNNPSDINGTSVREGEVKDEEVIRNEDEVREIGREFSCEILDQLLDELLGSLTSS